MVFYEPPTKVRKIIKINKWDLIKFKLKIFSTALRKGNHEQNEKTTHRMGKIFADKATNKGLISKIYR